MTQRRVGAPVAIALLAMALLDACAMNVTPVFTSVDQLTDAMDVRRADRVIVHDTFVFDFATRADATFIRDAFAVHDFGTDRDVGFWDATALDAVVPDAGVCRGFHVAPASCPGECETCATAAASGVCSAEYSAHDNPECVIGGFASCYPSCVAGVDASEQCWDRLAPRGSDRFCACYEYCIGWSPEVCREPRRDWDRCVIAHCPACQP